MSQHPSLRSSGKDKAHRSVLKRYERVKLLKEKEKWTDGESVYGLPKVKIVKYKVKKEKAVAAEGAEGAEGAAAAPGAAPAAGAAPAKAAGAKAAPAKDAAKSAGGDAKKPAK
jgi:small basic protein (TIGR04137 family)